MTGTRTDSVRVGYFTADGSAKGRGREDEEDWDYTATDGTLTFTPEEDSQTIMVATRDDNTEEKAETFTVNLKSPLGAFIGEPDFSGLNDPHPYSLGYIGEDCEWKTVMSYEHKCLAVRGQIPMTTNRFSNPNREWEWVNPKQERRSEPMGVPGSLTSWSWTVPPMPCGTSTRSDGKWNSTGRH